MSLFVFWKGFEIKSHQRRTHYLKRPRNGGCIPAWGGGGHPPPALVRVKGSLSIQCPYNMYHQNNFRNCILPKKQIISDPSIVICDYYVKNSANSTKNINITEIICKKSIN